MATIKAGTYRFNDVLTGSNGAHDTSFNEEVQFIITGGLTNNGDSVIINGSRIEGGVDNDIADMWYHLDSSNVDLSEYNLNLPAKFTVYHSDFNGWNPNYRDLWKTITIPNDSEVSAEFYEWFTANAVEQKEISGKWKFNDVLTVPSADGIEQSISFTVSSNVEYDGNTYSLDFICSSLGFAVMVNEVSEGGYLVDQCDLLAQLGDVFPRFVTLYDGGSGWRVSTYGEGIKTIDFGTEPQTVSAEFYNWLTANAVPVMASITHNGSTIAELFPGQTATLKCKGMKMEDDVVVAVCELPESGGSGECDKPHVIEVDELPEVGTDNGVYIIRKFSAIAICVNGDVTADFNQDSGINLKYYTATSLPEIGEENDVCYVESDNEIYIYYSGAWITMGMVLQAYGIPLEMKGVTTNTSTITEDGYYAVMGSTLYFYANGRYRTMIPKGGLKFVPDYSTAEGNVLIDGIEPYGDTSLILPSVSPNGETVTGIVSYAFLDCTSITSVVIPDSVKMIGRDAFAGCKALASVTIGNGIQSISLGAFSSCYSLDNLVIPDNVTSIGQSAFAGCYSLSNVIIGSGVKTIEFGAFRDCASLSHIEFNGTIEQWSAITKDKTWADGINTTAVLCTDGYASL